MKKRFFAGFAAAAIAASMMAALPASAADYTPLTPDGTADTYELVTFPTVDKYLVMEKDASVPSGIYTFTIAPGTAVAADNTANAEKMPILAGPAGVKFTSTDSTAVVSTTTPTTATLTFSSTDATVNEGTSSLSGKTIGFKTETTDDEEKVSLKTLTVDFSDVTFTEPGVYRYVITETGTIAGVTNDSDTTITLDVYVTDVNGALTLNSYVLHKDEAAPSKNNESASGGTLSDKTTGFTNIYDTQNLEFGKEVTGNQGSKDKRFAVTVTTTNANAATVYQLEGNWTKTITTATSATSYTETDMTTANNVTELTGAQLNNGYTFYLCDGEYVKVKGLEVVSGTGAVTYTISEEEEDYKKTATIATAVAQYGNVAHTDAVTGTITADKDVYTGFVNDRTGSIPTGVILAIAGPAVVGLVVAGGIIFLNVKKKREEAEE